MEKSENDEENIFIVEVNEGTSGSKTISIPAQFCKFCDIQAGDLIKLKLIQKKKSGKKQ